MVELSAIERLKLSGMLSSLPPTQFNQIVHALKPPHGIVAPRNASQGDRTFDLLEWIESPTGPGIETLLEILKHITNPDLDESLKMTSPRRRVILDIDANNVDNHQLKRIIDGLGIAIGGNSIRLVDIEEGSLKVEITGNLEKLNHLQTLIETGELTEVDGISIIGFEHVGEHIVLLQHGLEAWNQWRRKYPTKKLKFQNAILNGVNLSGVNLSGADFSGAILRFIDFSNTVLQSVNFSGATLTSSNFNGANLNGGTLSRANLKGGNFSKASLSGAILNDADLRYADFRYADLRYAELNGANVENAGFGSNLGLTEIDKQDLRSRGAILMDVRLGERMHFL